MNDASPAGSPFLLLTPTECALRGMIDHCVQHFAATGEQCVAILVTDGAPTLCNGDFTQLANIVAAGFDQGVLTFTLGLPGANIAFLDQLAIAGGTDCTPNTPGNACDLTAGSTGLIETLNSIRNTVVDVKTTPKVTPVTVATTLECQWLIPGLDDPDQFFEPEKANLTFTPPGAAGETFEYVPTLADCGTAANAWYFDNPEDPTEVLVCPAACDRLKATPGAQVDIQLGCDRIEKTPM
jgi:hypothetical protein